MHMCFVFFLLSHYIEKENMCIYIYVYMYIHTYKCVYIAHLTAYRFFYPPLRCIDSQSAWSFLNVPLCSIRTKRLLINTKATFLTSESS